MSAAERVRETRDAAERLVVVSHAFFCASAKKVRGKWVCDRLVKCDCGAAEKENAILDAYAAAVRAETLAEVREAVEGMRSFDIDGMWDQFVSQNAILAALTSLEVPDADAP